MLKPGVLLSDRWRRASKIFAVAAFVLGLSGLGVWLLNYFNVALAFTTGGNMKANTALGLMVCSLCLLALHNHYRQLAQLGLFLILAISLLTIANHAWNLNLNIDQWVLPDDTPVRVNKPVDWLFMLRAITFLFLAAAILLASYDKYTVGQLLAMVTFMVAYVALIDIFYSLTGFPIGENYIIISSHTALSFLFLSLASLLYCPSKGPMKLLSSNYAGGMLARKTFTYFLFVSPVLIGFYLHSLSQWQLSPGLAILALFLLTALITLPVTFYYLQRLNKIDAQLKRAHNNLQTINTDLSARNEALSEALADVKVSNRELAVMTKEALLSSQALELKNTELLRLNQSLDYIVQMASHDLKNPIFNLEYLIRELRPAVSPHLQPDDTHLFTLVEQSTASLKRTIEGLAQIIRSQQIIIGLQVSVSFPKLLHEIQSELAREIADRQARVYLHLAVEIMVFSRLHLHSVFLNLLSNALKYQAPDRPPVIHICTKQVPGGIEILFTDNGLGLSNYQVANLFSLYKRFHGHVEGSGIGLYIVKQTIENNGGTIQVKSTEGEGTQFTIFLPQKQ